MVKSTITVYGCDLLLSINRYKCCYCGACVGVCPSCALELVETWIEVSPECTECGICSKICPVGAPEVKR